MCLSPPSQPLVGAEGGYSGSEGAPKTAVLCDPYISCENTAGYFS